MAIITHAKSETLSRRGFLGSITIALASAPLGGCAGMLDFLAPANNDLSTARITAPYPTDKILVFHIAAGKITDSANHFICPAVSGNNNGRNNPASFTHSNCDPIPPGWWEIHPKSYAPHITRDVMWLSPSVNPYTGAKTDPMGRAELCLHELKGETPGYYAETTTNGCVGVSRPAINTLFDWRGKGQILVIQVVPG